MKKQLSIFLIVLISSIFVLSASTSHTSLNTYTNSNNNTNKNSSNDKSTIKTASNSNKSGSAISGLKSSLLLNKSKVNLAEKSQILSSQVGKTENNLSVLNFFNKEKTRLETQPKRIINNENKSSNNNNSNNNSQETNDDSFNYLLNKRISANSSLYSSQNKFKKQNKEKILKFGKNIKKFYGYNPIILYLKKHLIWT